MARIRRQTHHHVDLRAEHPAQQLLRLARGPDPVRAQQLHGAGPHDDQRQHRRRADADGQHRDAAQMRAPRAVHRQGHRGAQHHREGGAGRLRLHEAGPREPRHRSPQGRHRQPVGAHGDRHGHRNAAHTPPLPDDGPRHHQDSVDRLDQRPGVHRARGLGAHVTDLAAHPEEEPAGEQPERQHHSTPFRAEQRRNELGRDHPEHGTHRERQEAHDGERPLVRPRESFALVLHLGHHREEHPVHDLPEDRRGHHHERIGPPVDTEGGGAEPSSDHHVVALLGQHRSDLGERVPESVAEEIETGTQIETRPNGVPGGEVHRDRAQRDLRQVRDHERPDPEPLPGQDHTDAGVADDVAGQVDRREETEPELPGQERFADRVQPVDGKEQRHPTQHRLDRGHPIEVREERCREPDARAQHESQRARDREGGAHVNRLELQALHDRGPDADLGDDLRERDHDYGRAHEPEVPGGQQPPQGHEHEQLHERLQAGAAGGPQHAAERPSGQPARGAGPAPRQRIRARHSPTGDWRGSRRGPPRRGPPFPASSPTSGPPGSRSRP